MVDIGLLKARDDEFVQDALRQFKEQTARLVDKIHRADIATLTVWHKKIDLAIARRIVQLEIISEARVAEGQEITKAKADEALRRATDRLSFEKDLSEFMSASAANIKQLLQWQEDEDRLFRVDLTLSDKQFTDGLTARPENEELIASRDQKRADMLKIRLTERESEFNEIFAANLELLAELEAADIDTLDGKSLEDYCFDG